MSDVCALNVCASLTPEIPSRILGIVASLPQFNVSGDLPVGIHQTSLAEVLQRFGEGATQRRNAAERLVRVFRLASETGHVSRFILFGSFITAAPAPNDVDVFLLMDDTFDVEQVRGESAILFNHQWAQSYFGASVFWLRRLAALDGEQAVVEHWQIKRDGTHRGSVEVTSDDSK